MKKIMIKRVLYIVVLYGLLELINYYYPAGSKTEMFVRIIIFSIINLYVIIKKVP